MMKTVIRNVFFTAKADLKKSFAKVLVMEYFYNL